MADEAAELVSDPDPDGGPAAVGRLVPVGMVVGSRGLSLVDTVVEAGLKLGALHLPLMEVKFVSGKISISSVPQLVY